MCKESATGLIYAFFTPRLTLFTAFFDANRYDLPSGNFPAFGEQHGFDGRHGRSGYRAALACHLGLGARLRQTGSAPMNTTFYIIGAVVSAALMVYLVIALLKAEDL
jgi:K+-transporting ATPase KdpF subunit